MAQCVNLGKLFATQTSPDGQAKVVGETEGQTRGLMSALHIAQKRRRTKQCPDRGTFKHIIVMKNILKLHISFFSGRLCLKTGSVDLNQCKSNFRFHNASS